MTCDENKLVLKQTMSPLFIKMHFYRGEKRDPDADDEGEIKMSVVIIRLSQGMIDHPEEEKKNK